MYYWLISLIIGVCFLATFLIFRVKQQRVIAVVFKGLTSLMFIITALISWKCSQNPQTSFGIFVLVALFFGLLGDVFLDIKYIALKHEFIFTVLGFFAFGIGHIFFITGLFIHFYNFSSHLLYLILPIVASIVCTVVTLLMEKITAIKYGNMKPFAIGYGLILFFVTTLYLSASIQNGWHIVTINMMFVCLVLFALSDLVLNNTYFAPNCNTPAFIIINHVLYYLAQFGIAISLFFLI